MSTDYELRLYSPTLVMQCPPIRAFEKLSASRVVNGVGSATFVLNDPDGFYYEFMDRDVIIEIYRTFTGGYPYLELDTFWLVRFYEASLDADGNQVLTIIAFDANELLKRRWIIAAAGSTVSTKTAALDDMMKTIMTENFGSSASGSRNISAVLAIQANFTAAPSKLASFQGKRVLEVFQDLASLSYTAGVYLAFDLVWNGANLTFQTFTGARGVDHTYPNGIPPIFIDPALRNLTEVKRSTDFRDEVSIVYAYGQGTGTDRVSKNSADVTRQTGPYAYIEKYIDARNNNDPAGVQSEADAELRASKIRRSFRGKLVETDNLLYGRDYKFGDVVTAQYRGEAINCRLDQITINFENGQETVSANLQADS